METLLFLKNKDGSQRSVSKLHAFSFRKEAFMPYTTLTAVFYSDMPVDDIMELRLLIDGRLIHKGIADTVESTFSADGTRITAASRGYTSLLTENQMQPGMYMNISLNELFGNYLDMPNIEHEENDTSSYAYINKGAMMWDAVSNISYKLTGNYPYIRSANKVMMNMPENAGNFIYTDYEVLKTGSAIDTRRLVSNFHMADIGGEYGTYEYTDSEAAARDIVRHRYFDLDRRFLHEPVRGCIFRDIMAKRGCRRKYIVYSGYKGEDLNDIFSYGVIQRKRVKSLKITGTRRGVFTEVGTYID